MQPVNLSSPGNTDQHWGPVPVSKATATSLPAPAESSPLTDPSPRIGSAGPDGHIWGPVLHSPVTATSLAGGGKSSAPSATPQSGTSAPAPAKVASGGGAQGAAGFNPAGESNPVVEFTTGYPTTVAGKQYAATVVEYGGQYEASVASLSGATANGSSEQSAENNLNVRVDELV